MTTNRSPLFAPKFYGRKIYSHKISWRNSKGNKDDFEIDIVAETLDGDFRR